MKILVVDDDEGSRVFLQRLVMGRGDSALTAKDGNEALVLAKQESPDLIIADILMPDMDGFELCRRIKEDLALFRIPFMFYTGTYGGGQDEELALSLGACRFLRKPMPPEQLADVIEDVFAQPKTEALGPQKVEEEVRVLHQAVLSKKLMEKIGELEKERVKLHREMQIRRDTEERFRLLVEGTKDYAIYLINPMGIITSWNEGARRIKGYEHQEIIGKHIACFYTEEDRRTGKHDEILRQALEQGLVQMEGWRVRKDGSCFWANVVLTPLFDEQGQHRGFSQVTRDITDRKWAEEAMQESEERLRTMYNAATDAIFLLDPQQKAIVEVNPRASQLLGYSQEELQGMPISRIHPQEMERFSSFLDGILGGEVIRTDQFTCTTKSHQVIPAEISFSKMELKGRTFVLALVRDIIERKRAEEELHAAYIKLTESEASYRSLFENALYGIAISGADFKFKKVNDAWCQLIGYTEDELVEKMGIADVTLPERFWESKELLDKLVSREVTEGHIEKSLKTKTGEIIDTIVFIKGMYDEQGKYLGSAASILDITDRKRAEKALQEHQENLEELVAERTRDLELSEAKFRILYHNSPALMISVDVETKKIVECNDTLLKELGFTREEVIGKEVFEIYHPDSVEKAHQTFKRFMVTNEIHDAELQLAKKDGQKIDVLLDVSAHVDNQTGMKRTLSIWRDITDRKQMERELILAKGDLESANARLKELDLLKSMFIASMSHELRTPLNAIISFSGILLQNILGEINDRQRNSLERMQRAGKHLQSLITDVIDISKIEAGRVDLFVEEVPLKSLVQEALDTVHLQAEEKGLQLEVTSASFPTIRTDSRRLLQCLVNLLSNAVKYTERGRVLLAVSSDETAVTFAVSDTGIGIAEENVPKLFQAFERLDSHLKILAKGTGLGLYLTRALAVDLLQGDLAVQSVLGKGSTFTLSVPKTLVERTLHMENTS